MKRKYKIAATMMLAIGLVVGWNLQDKQVAQALLGTNTRISDANSTTLANGDAGGASVSNDGNLITFSSSASNLVSGDTNGASDIFLKDMKTGVTSRISVDSSGNQANGSSSTPVISGDGRFVFYASGATNLVSSDTNGYTDIFKYTISSGAVERVSVDSTGTQANQQSGSPDVDYEGRFLVFASQATNLDSLGASDSNLDNDIFLKDLNTGTVTYLSQSDTGVVGNNYSSKPKISCDGRFISFSSTASNLVPSDTNGQSDAFYTDMLGTRTIKNITLGGNNYSGAVDISCDGRYILFDSIADNLGVNPYPYNGLDTFRFNRVTSTLEGVSVREDGSAPNQGSSGLAISSDGRFVLFGSSGANFITSITDSNSTDDIFLRDMDAAPGFRIVSKNASNVIGNFRSTAPAFSGSNRIVFSSQATNLATNGPTDNTNKYDIFITDVGTPNTCTF